MFNWAGFCGEAIKPNETDRDQLANSTFVSQHYIDFSQVRGTMSKTSAKSCSQFSENQMESRVQSAERLVTKAYRSLNIGIGNL